jgi:hypothetical protein
MQTVEIFWHMSRRRRRTKSCSRADATARLDQAASFADLARLADPSVASGPERSAAVSNAVLAGIGAADAICCVRLGVHASGDNHHEAVTLLGEVPDIGNEAATAMTTLLGLKQKAQYGATDPSRSETTRALRAMSRIVELARLNI